MKMTIKIAKKLLEHAGYNVIIDDEDILTEMAFDKRDIQFEFKNQLSQIYQNWCLLYYVKQTKDKMELANHWSEELLTALLNVSSMKLINGNKRKKVYDALKEMFYVKLEYGNADLNMKCRLTKKFENEKIVYDLNELQEAFKNNINQLMTLIAYSNDTDIERYCYEFWK